MLCSGGKLDPQQLAGAPIVVSDAVVKTITDGRWVGTKHSVGEGGMRNLGPMVKLAIGTVDVLVRSSPV